MARAMIFIDGTWLYTNTPRLAEIVGRKEYHVDFGRLPAILAGVLSSRIVSSEQCQVPVDIVRTTLFGSYANNFDRADHDTVQRRLDFFHMLREEHGYEINIYPINFFGRRLRRIDRESGDNFEPREKCVDIAMASNMVAMAANNSYDIAICVLGDSDFRPALQEIRHFGKRVQLVSVKGGSHDLTNTVDSRVSDFDTIWLEDHAIDMELVYTAYQRDCESPDHVGSPTVTTTFRPRKGQRFYCDACRAEFQKNRAGFDQHDSPGEFVKNTSGESIYHGTVKKLTYDRGFGFIESEEGMDYFFHMTDIIDGTEFAKLVVGEYMTFQVKRAPGLDGKAGAACNVAHGDAPLDEHGPDHHEDF